MILTRHSPDSIDYDGYATGVEGLGPGSRVVVWVRGCQRHCPGCIAPELWEHGKHVSVDAVLNDLRGPLLFADGLTMTGGEPFEQAEALTTLITRIREEKYVEVVIYTGYQLEEIQAGEESWNQLLMLTDILIDGPYIENHANTLIWRGSDNQRIHLLTDRVKHQAHYLNATMPEERPIQIRMLSPTRFRLIGIPQRGDFKRYRQLLSEQGLEVIRGHE